MTGSGYYRQIKAIKGSNSITTYSILTYIDDEMWSVVLLVISSIHVVCCLLLLILVSSVRNEQPLSISFLLGKYHYYGEFLRCYGETRMAEEPPTSDRRALVESCR